MTTNLEFTQHANSIEINNLSFSLTHYFPMILKLLICAMFYIAGDEWKIHNLHSSVYLQLTLSLFLIPRLDMHLVALRL